VEAAGDWIYIIGDDIILHLEIILKYISPSKTKHKKKNSNRKQRKDVYKNIGMTLFNLA
jgi:hypothetical protein